MKLSRRAFVQGLGGLALAGSSVVAAVRFRGYPARANLLALREWEYAVVEAAALRIANPDADDMPTARAVGVADFVDRFVLELTPRARRDLGRLFAYLEHLAPLRSGYARRFSKLLPDEQDQVLSQMEASDETLLRGAFAGLKSLVLMGYYRSPKTWKAIGYTGPFVRRAEESP